MVGPEAFTGKTAVESTPPDGFVRDRTRRALYPEVPMLATFWAVTACLRKLERIPESDIKRLDIMRHS
jgi:hypothetical protein